ncbi:MAG: hypothetical protein EZS28_009289 [Streblomastix strix]|uniref:Bromo domain-containing protein n=1 Tax=Streblomastix strix TaxID=222440 RepID=A0A5J4WJW5_9EUKA|nr:MAG: hypothetical protein EZS28_009289 [Streblomastix strix]
MHSTNQEASSSSFISVPEQRAQERMEAIKQIVYELMANKKAYPFNTPVDIQALNIPDYQRIIKVPMDFGTIQRKIDNNKYNGLAEAALADLFLVFDNAFCYNGPLSQITSMAKELQKQLKKKLERTLLFQHEEINLVSTTYPEKYATGGAQELPDPILQYLSPPRIQNASGLPSFSLQHTQNMNTHQVDDNINQQEQYSDFDLKPREASVQANQRLQLTHMKHNTHLTHQQQHKHIPGSGIKGRPPSNPQVGIQSNINTGHIRGHGRGHKSAKSIVMNQRNQSLSINQPYYTGSNDSLSGINSDRISQQTNSGIIHESPSKYQSSSSSSSYTQQQQQQMTQPTQTPIHTHGKVGRPSHQQHNTNLPQSRQQQTNQYQQQHNTNTGTRGVDLSTPSTEVEQPFVITYNTPNIETLLIPFDGDKDPLTLEEKIRVMENCEKLPQSFLVNLLQMIRVIAPLTPVLVLSGEKLDENFEKQRRKKEHRLNKKKSGNKDGKEKDQDDNDLIQIFGNVSEWDDDGEMIRDIERRDGESGEEKHSDDSSSESAEDDKTNDGSSKKVDDEEEQIVEINLDEFDPQLQNHIARYVEICVRQLSGQIG